MPVLRLVYPKGPSGSSASWPRCRCPGLEAAAVLPHLVDRSG